MTKRQPPVRWFGPETDRMPIPAVERARRGIQRVLDIGAERAGSIFTRFDAAKVLAAAQDADRSAADRAPGGLAGMTISIKDLFDVAGEVTAAGSRHLRHAPPAERTATAVARLIAAGAVPFGRTSMSEFAYSGVGLNPHFGTPGNGRDIRRIPGGSTSGGGVSVALGLCDAALGSDTGGSIRIPAALNGLAGFKPSQASVPLDGVFPLASVYDSIGQIAPTITQCAAIHAILSAGSRPTAVVGLAGLRIGIVRTLSTDGLDAQVSADFEAALKAIRDAGAVLDDVDIPGMGEAGRVNRILVATEAFAIHQSRLKALETEGDPHVYRRIISGGTFSQQERDEALALRRQASLAFNGTAQAFDVLISPTVAVTAPLIAEVESDFDRLNALILRNPSAVNFLDGCAATIPMNAPDAQGAGLMVIGANGSDWKVLAAAETLEQVVARR